METDFCEALDVMGEQPPLTKLYTQISSFYELPEEHSQGKIIDILKEGLDRLSVSFPWVAGQVVKRPSGGDGPPRLKIVPLEKAPRLTVRNNDSRSLEEFKLAQFPCSMLDEAEIAPCPTLAALLEPTASSEEAPNFLVQANFIKGGLIITFNGQHNVMDMTGQGEMIRLFSKACRKEAFTKEELEIGNMPRENLVPSLNNYTPGPELDNSVTKLNPDPPLEETPPPPPSCSWAYFSFSSSSLTSLKRLASESLSSGFVSTDDVISAFIWQSVLRARSHRLPSDRTVRFARAVDARRFLDLPTTYPGIIQNMTYHSYTLNDLISLPLGTVSANLRAGLDPADIAYRTRALATFIRSGPENAARANATAKLDVSSDIALSSWSKIGLYEYDFGLGLGKPVAVRRPKFMPFESLFYLMPKGRDGEIAAMFSIRDEDMERLKADEEFGKYASFIG